MFNLFFAIFMAFACPAHNKGAQRTGAVATAAYDTGGDKEHLPPPPPPPPGS